MSVVQDHIGYWTAEDLLAMPDDDTGNRYEVIDGALFVTPAPGYPHQRASFRLGNLLQAAAAATGTDAEVMLTLNFRVPNGLLIPDVLVVKGSTAEVAPNVLTFSDVLAVVEIASPSSRRMDRLLKPSVYADAGVPTYWRVELEPVATVVVSTLVDGIYREVCTATAGTTTMIPSPYAIPLDPADILKR
jgi:Uma2 family endonuclease